MDKSPDAFRTISEVAEWLGVQAHVLRFWESKFAQVKPVKRAGGRRYYRPSDMQLLGGVKKLLHDDGLTIKGVQKILREQGVGHVSSLSQGLGAATEGTAETVSEKPKVVQFKSTAVKPGTAASIDPTPVLIDHEPTEEIATEPAPSNDAQPTPEPIAPTPAFVSAKGKPKPDAAPAPSADTEEPKPVLPSFLHRPAPELAKETAPEPEVAAKRPLAIEAPDPPAESELPYVRGPLAELAALDTLNAAQIARIAPLAEELQAWLARSGGAGAS